MEFSLLSTVILIFSYHFHFPFNCNIYFKSGAMKIINLLLLNIPNHAQIKHDYLLQPKLFKTYIDSLSHILIRKHSYFSAILTLEQTINTGGDKHDKTTHVGKTLNFDFKNLTFRMLLLQK